MKDSDYSSKGFFKLFSLMQIQFLALKEPACGSSVGGFDFLCSIPCAEVAQQIVGDSTLLATRLKVDASDASDVYVESLCPP